MIIRDWLGRKDIETFGAQLAAELRRRFPPESMARKDKGAEHQLASICRRLFQSAAEYSRAKGLGLYGRAKLGNTFRWNLTDAGYAQSFADEVTRELIVSLTGPRQTR